MQNLAQTTFLLAVAAALILSPVSSAATTEDAALLHATDQAIILPEPIPDPIEPVNRFLWEVNKGLMIGVIQPTGKGYRFIVRKPIRTGIRNVGRNLEYPRKVVNNLLQGRWTGARDETYRFLCNSTLGLAGFFDVATRWEIPEANADFGQTFGLWGWRPQVYLMLPVAGPSNERDALGSFADSLVNPITYFPPYSYIPHGIRYNNLTDSIDEYVRASKTDHDPYYVLRYAWTLRRENRDVELTFEGPQDPASLDTLQSVFFSFRNTDFPQQGDTKKVSLLSSGRELPFTMWLQESPAPVVYIIPGLGSHRWSGQTLGLAELLYSNGYSVVTVSSAFNYEFIERGASTALPGYAPVDTADMHQAISQIDQHLRNQFGSRIGKRALLGYSMGGFHSLYLAATEANRPANSPQFDRYVALNAPVRLLYAVDQLDGFFRSALQWPADQRTENIERIFLKVAALARNFDQLTPDTQIPFNTLESRFVIGLAFRLSLRDIIFTTQNKTNQGVLQNPIGFWKREPVYNEILQYSFAEYLQKFVVPYYQSRGLDLADPAVLQPGVDLRAHAPALQQNSRVRLITNENDMLLAPEDLAFLRTTFNEERLTTFERGGHVGNLHLPAVQQAILKALENLN